MQPAENIASLSVFSIQRLNSLNYREKSCINTIPKLTASGCNALLLDLIVYRDYFQNEFIPSRPIGFLIGNQSAIDVRAIDLAFEC